MNLISDIESQWRLRRAAHRYSQSPELHVARLEMILEAGRVLNALLDLNELLPAVLEAAMQLTGAQAGAILLVEPKTDDLYLEAITVSGQTDLKRRLVPLEGTMAGWIAQHGEALALDHLPERGPYWAEFDPGLNLAGQAILGVPLKLKQQTIGVLEVFDKERQADFSGDDIYMLNTLAAQAAVAIDNARRLRQTDHLERLLEAMSVPAATITGFSRLLLVEPELASEEARQGLNRINQEASRLTQMIAGFLELTQLETGRITLARERLKLPALAQAAVMTVEPRAAEKRVKLAVDPNGDIPEIEGDSSRLKQVMDILLDQAIRASGPDGSVEIKLFCNGVRVQAAVYHGGPGLPAEVLNRVFDQFYYDSAADPDGDAGLGLALAKKIVEAHNGDIWVERQGEAGGCFAFSLPVGEV
jgi:K+-sensing histidine kinase KdpD